jgi:hypothetical protein
MAANRPPPDARSAGAAAVEVIPMKGVERQLDHLPTQAVVTVTSSPTRGLVPTLRLAAVLREQGWVRVMPHGTARLVRDHARLRDVLRQITDLGGTCSPSTRSAGPGPGDSSRSHSTQGRSHDLK